MVSKVDKVSTFFILKFYSTPGLNQIYKKTCYQLVYRSPTHLPHSIQICLFLKTAAYNLAYIYTSDLYPTETRNTAIQFMTSVGGASSLICPQINMLKTYVWGPLPYIIYSVTAMLATLCVWQLPNSLVLIVNTLK